MTRFGRSRKSGKTERKPDGQIRQSQLIGAYGAGAMVDLLQHAVVISGLDDWNHVGERLSIEEPRLKDRIEELYKLKLDDEDYFRLAPAGDDNEPSPRLGVRALEFPAWFVCHSCRRLVHRKGLGEATHKDGRRYHDCDPKGVPVVPVRFVGACPSGHLQDFPWIDFAHWGKDRCKNPELWFREGVHGDFSEIRVSCSCGAIQRLHNVNAKEFVLECRGERPWLPPGNHESCKNPLRLLVRTASNSYFAMALSALSVPDPDNVIRDALSRDTERIKKRLEKGDERLRTFLEDDHDSLVAQHGMDAVLAQAKLLAQGQATPRLPIRTGEYLQLTRYAEPARTGEHFDEDITFVARTIDVDTTLRARVRSIALVHRLREVRVQFGFTRLEPASADNQGEPDSLDVRRAPLAIDAKWLPAASVQGEGIFLELCPDAVEEWSKRKPVQTRAAELDAGWKKWHEDRPGADRKIKIPPFLGAKFYLLHSLSHLLINTIAMDCGYSASAIRERIYCGPYKDDPSVMAGIMLYTGTVGSEGTLGGLVEQGKRLDDHIARALRAGSLCSNDPLCGSHSPLGDLSDRLLEGAACHGCLFISESSCERFNRYLDRALVVPVVGQPAELAFFNDADLWL
jgi:hypothetical protein